MSELLAVAREAARLRDAGTPFLLATVVRVSGSSYRRPGARMIVAEDRRLAGCVSGGCLEGDVLLRGLHRTRSGPVVVTYDSTSDDDITWGFGLGCNGVVEVLLERVDGCARLDPMRFVAECLDAEEPGVLATIVRGDVGERLVRRGERV
ncbi:MAG TPA: XdhC family protein, partial [Labilithrix sp.]